MIEMFLFTRYSTQFILEDTKRLQLSRCSLLSNIYFIIKKIIRTLPNNIAN